MPAAGGSPADGSRGGGGVSHERILCAAGPAGGLWIGRFRTKSRPLAGGGFGPGASGDGEPSLRRGALPPVRWSCSAAWGWRAESFGAETAGREQLLDTAWVLLDSRLSEALRPYLDRGLSFPRNQSRAAADLRADATVLERPNDFWRVSTARPFGALGATDAPAHCPARGLPRPGGRPGQPLATALRLRILTGQPWLSHVPEAVRPAYAGGAPQLGLGERRFWRGCGPWSRRICRASRRCGGTRRKLCGECRRQNTLEEIFDGGQVQAVHPEADWIEWFCAPVWGCRRRSCQRKRRMSEFWGSGTGAGSSRHADGASSMHAGQTRKGAMRVWRSGAGAFTVCLPGRWKDRRRSSRSWCCVRASAAGRSKGAPAGAKSNEKVPPRRMREGTWRSVVCAILWAKGFQTFPRKPQRVRPSPPPPGRKAVGQPGWGGQALSGRLIRRQLFA